MLGLKRGTVSLDKDFENWNLEFKTEKQKLNNILFEYILDVQHVGSTSIPNLSAKPIIDILVGIKSMNDFVSIKKIMENLKYEYRENGSNQNKFLFVKGPEEKRTHYIHFTELNSAAWRNTLFFRNYLTLNPDVVTLYENLKKDLLLKFTEDRASYTKGKESFILGVLLKNNLN